MSAHQAAVLLFDLALIIVLAKLLGAGMRKMGQPAVIGEILAGILLGPTLLGAAASEALFPLEVRPFLAALANVGVAMFMFVVGLEFDRTMLRGQSRIAVAVSLGSIAVPFGCGAVVAVVLLRQHPHDHPTGFVLFLGVAMAVTAFPVLARILTDGRLQHTPLGSLALTCAAVGDLIAWSLLAMVVAMVGSGGQEVWHLALFVPYVLAMFGLVRPLLRRLVLVRAPGLFIVVLAGLLISAGVTELLGLHFIFGAFLFGCVVPREGAQRLRAELSDRLGEASNVLLLPVFFLAAGLQVDLSGIGVAGVGELGLILLAAIGGKVTGTFAGARLFGMPARRSAVLAVLMNTRGLTELVVLSVGRELGVLDGRLYSIMVVTAVVTTAMTGPLLRLLYPRHLLEEDRRNAGVARDFLPAD